MGKALAIDHLNQAKETLEELIKEWSYPSNTVDVEQYGCYFHLIAKIETNLREVELEASRQLKQFVKKMHKNTLND